VGFEIPATGRVVQAGETNRYSDQVMYVRLPMPGQMCAGASVCSVFLSPLTVVDPA